MKERIVDLALIGALVVVAAVLVFTLFSPLPARNRAAPPADDPVSNASAPDTSAAATADLTLIAPGEELESEVVTAGSDEPPSPAADAPAEAADAVTPAPDARGSPPSTDAVALERIGFSYAGVVGACNVELEPWVHVAVSRDLLERYPCGSEVTVVLDEPVAGRRSVRAMVADTLGPAAQRTANLYIDPSEPANEYGVTTGRLEP